MNCVERAQEGPTMYEKARDTAVGAAAAAGAGAQNLKDRVMGPSTGTGTGTGSGYSSGTQTGTGTGYGTGTGTGTGTGYTSGTGTGAGTGYGTGTGTGTGYSTTGHSVRLGAGWLFKEACCILQGKHRMLWRKVTLSCSRSGMRRAGFRLGAECAGARRRARPCTRRRGTQPSAPQPRLARVRRTSRTA